MSNIVKNTIIVFITILFAMIGFFSISFFERAYRYTTIDEEASDIIANYIGFDVSKIQRIDKIIYQSYIRDSDMYIFAEVDWPELWESSLTISAVEIKDLINPSDSFTSDAHISYSGSNGRTLIIYRLYDKNRVAIYVDEYIVDNLWGQLKSHLKK